jgi:hypothetical protein
MEYEIPQYEQPELPDVEYEVEVPKKAVKLPKKPDLSINMPKAGMNV